MALTQTFGQWLVHGGYMHSSGTTGKPKRLWQSPQKIKASNEAAINSQELTVDSKVYTVCDLGHAGGLFAQTLPAIVVGAFEQLELVIDFNAYKFVREIKDYTHTHITPGHAKAIMMTKGFETLDLTGIWVTCGSDRVTWDIIEAFVERGATFMVNWGMTEVGPTAINQVFRNMEDVVFAKQFAIEGATIMGNRFYCDHQIVGDTLFVRGNISVNGDTWFDTGDIVKRDQHGTYYYIGRANGDNR